MTPPKPVPRPDRVSLWHYARAFRRDILSAQPARLYRAWMAEFRTPFFTSFLVNEPGLVDMILNRRPMDFPKSDRVSLGLRPLLGRSVFVTNGAEWQRQRRIIDPAFAGGRLRQVLPAMDAACAEAVARLRAGEGSGAEIEVEEVASHLAADIIFRTLFSIPIGDATATAVFDAFRAYQRAQPVLNLGAILPIFARWPRLHGRRTRGHAARIRSLIATLTTARAALIAAGNAPDDLATKIMTTPDPETGQVMSAEEMVDQVAIFFLAGHETSAAALAWALYLLASHPEWQDRLRAEARGLPAAPGIGDVAALRIARDVFRETLRLYPPVPMMVRQAAADETMRGRKVPRGAQIVLSPWYLQRHERLWDRPDEFDPARFATENGAACLRDAFIPFSSGARVCIGAGFAMIEGPLMLARLVAAFRFAPAANHQPVPVAHLTLRARDGIRLAIGPSDQA